MSVTASISCRDCDSYAPDPGDCGHIGYPTLDDDAYMTENFAAFEYIYRGYSALGLRLLELDRIRSWLIEHASHDVRLYYEGEEIEGPEANEEHTPTLSTEVFREEDYGRGFFELSCPNCDETYRSGRSCLLLPFHKDLSVAQTGEFRERVLNVEPENFHRTSDLLDPRSSEFEALTRFVNQHRRHRLVARSVSGEAWTEVPVSISKSGRMTNENVETLGGPNRIPARVSLPPPLHLRWTFQAAIKAPLLKRDGRLFTLGGKRQWVIALDQAGEELWRSEPFGENALWDMFLQPDCLWIPVYLREHRSYNLCGLDPGSGRVLTLVENARNPRTFLSPNRFIGNMYKPDDRPVEAFGVYSIDEGLETLWESEVALDTSRGAFGSHCAAEGSRIFAAHGTDVIAFDRETGGKIWRTDLSGFGRAWGPSGGSPLTVCNGIVIYGLMGSVHALSADSGSVIWSREDIDAGLPRTTYTDKVILAGSGYWGSSEETSVCLGLLLATGEPVFRSSLGSPAWQATPAPRPLFCTRPRPTDECIYLGDRDGRLWALSPTDGEPLWTHGLQGCSGWLGETIVIANDRLYVFDNQGKLFCLTS